MVKSGFREYFFVSFVTRLHSNGVTKNTKDMKDTNGD
jgi:hypothetical protein